MVATVGSISIDLSTNTVKFAQGFKSAASTVDRESARMTKSIAGFDKAMRLTGTAAKGFIGGLAAGGAFAALASLSGAIDKVRQSLADFEEIGNRAKAVGLDTDVFQAISFGAEQADVSQEKLNRSLEVFTKNVGLAREGTGGLSSGLERLNPALLDSILNAGSQEERLKLVADALAATTDATEKAAIATAAFGRGGIEMVRVLDGGAASIDRFVEEARKLGLIVPRELIERAGELDDQLSVLGRAIDLNISLALVNAAPVLVKAAEGLAQFAKELNRTSAELTAFAENPTLENLGKLLHLELIEGGAADRIRDFFEGMSESAGRSAAEIEADILEVQKYLGDLFQQAEQGADVRLEVGGALQKLDLLKRELAEVGAAAKAGIAATGALESGLGAALEGAFRTAAGNVRTGPADTANDRRERAEEQRWGVHRSLLQQQTGAVQDTAESVDALGDDVSDSGDRIGARVDDLGGTVGEETRYQTGQLLDGLSSLGATFRSASGQPGSVTGTAGQPTIREEISGGAPRGVYTSTMGSTADLFRWTDAFAPAEPVNETGAISTSGEPPMTNVYNLTYNAALGESDATARQNARRMLGMFQTEVARA
jgi:hypothetical protein